ncbi:MAG: AI-2E family transporter [Deltaproteobacteria bacterium]|nr:AI-2E family transporter [Deltaproteobacteria bacterium]
MSERISFVTLLMLLCVAVLWLFRPFFPVILISLTIVISLWPFFQWVTRLFRGYRWLASLLVTLLLAILLIFPITFLVSRVADQAVTLVRILPDTLKQWLPIIKEWSGHFKIAMPWEAILPELIQKGTQVISQFSPKILMQTTQFVLSFALTLFITFFLFLEGPSLYKNLLILSPLKEAYENDLSKEIRNTLNACLYGQILTALAQSLLAGIGFTIVQLPVAAVLATITLFTSFIPFVGAAAIWIPVAVYLLVTHQWWPGIFMAIYGTLVISGVDNLIKPLIIRGRTGIHPLWIFLAILGGLQALGPIGLLVGPIIIAIFVACVRIYKRDFLKI